MGMYSDEAYHGVPLTGVALPPQITVYPRLAIDSSTRVRQLSHVAHGQIAVLSGKRLARHMPKIVGLWLASLHDTDRSAAKLADAALRKVFNSAEKLLNVFVIFQKEIILFCRSIICNESMDTLTDQRIVGIEEADMTYARVLSMCFSLLNDLLERLPLMERSKHIRLYENLLTDRGIWKFALYKDSIVRSSVYKLLTGFIQNNECTSLSSRPFSSYLCLV